MTVVSGGNARELLVDLVSTPSPSGEEGDVASRLVEFFEEHDHGAWIDAAGNVRAPGSDEVLLTSHLDTVPGQIPVRTESIDGEPVLWGRGSVDATGSLAAMAVAAVRTGASFVGVVREETDSHGARSLIADREAPEAVINGEPSGWDAIALAYRGLLAGTYTATTEAVHGSRPEQNAIQRAIDWWSDVEATVAEFGDAAPADGGSEPPAGSPASVFESVTATPLAIDGGRADDGRSVESTVAFELRVPPSVEATTIREAIEAHVGAVDDDLPLTETVDWTESIPPVAASPRTSVGRALRTAIRASSGRPEPVI